MVETVFGITIDVRDLHLQKTWLPMVVTLFGITMDAIVVTLFGITIDAREAHTLKAQ